MSRILVPPCIVILHALYRVVLTGCYVARWLGSPCATDSVVCLGATLYMTVSNDVNVHCV